MNSVRCFPFAVFVALLGSQWSLIAEVYCPHGKPGAHPDCSICASTSGGGGSSVHPVPYTSPSPQPVNPTASTLGALNTALQNYNNQVQQQSQTTGDDAAARQQRREEYQRQREAQDDAVNAKNNAYLRDSQISDNSEKARGDRRASATAKVNFDASSSNTQATWGSGAGKASSASQNTMGSAEGNAPVWTFGPSGPPKDNGIPSSLWGKTQQIIQEETSSTWRTYQLPAPDGIISFNPNTSELAKNPVTGQYEAVLREEYLQAVTSEEWVK